MDTIDFRLLNEFQRDFPLVERPFEAIGRSIGLSEAEVIDRYAALAVDGYISRIGVVFAPHAAGSSTLAAMAVPPERLEEVADFVSEQPETNHNYEREHHWNLWFVLAAPTATAVKAAVTRIQEATGIAVLVLPMLEEFHIDLGFDMVARNAYRRQHVRSSSKRRSVLTRQQRRLVACVQEGLAMVPAPFALVAERAGCTQEEVLGTLGEWLEQGIARRVGVVVRHRALGFQANAMVVWDVPDAEIARVAPLIAANPEVTLCYHRPKRLPEWPYNLFCMIHGRDRKSVLATLARLRHDPVLVGVPFDVLFSTRCFKQRGARYAEAA